MLPLKIAFLWHNHQPFYKMEDEFILPWTRLHGVKDYFDIPEILHEFPEIKQTFNLVPSLSVQLKDYISGKTKDNIQRLTSIPASELNEEQKKEILNLFFLCNEENLIKPYKRFKELYERSRDSRYALDTFKESDWRDIQVWYNLVWIGPYSRKYSGVNRFFEKERNFSEEEKLIIMDKHIEILKKIDPQLKTLKNLKQIEISTTPFHHPILPLLCDSMSAREAMPYAQMPDPIYFYPEDAEIQIHKAMEYYKSIFNSYPNGMWPSEGSISNKALELMINAGLKWAASDEGIITSSLPAQTLPTEKFFPREYRSEKGKIGLLFRDHFLSDRIGFVYSQWNPWDAANDFTHHLHQIRNEIIRVHGDEGLEYACVSVILDGENCWEFYQDNGVPFLRELFSQLTNMKEFQTVTCSEATEDVKLEYVKPISNIKAGSWINSNFSIWIGHEEDRKAWSMLGKARAEFEKRKSQLDKNTIDEILEHIYVAEGSDWYWWYGPEHKTANDKDFDRLFRWHIKKIYELMGSDIPEEVSIPINSQSSLERFTSPKSEINPKMTGKYSKLEEWENGGYFNARLEASAMHQVGELLSAIRFGSNANDAFLRFEFIKEFDDNDSILLIFTHPKKIEIKIEKHSFKINSKEDLYINNLRIAYSDVVEIALSLSLFGLENKDDVLMFKIFTNSNGNELSIPKQNLLELKL